MERHGFEAGPDQVIVVYSTSDDGTPVDAELIFADIATDAAERAPHGWAIQTMTALSIRQMGTAGNILFQSGGQFATRAAIAVVYRRSNLSA